MHTQPTHPRLLRQSPLRVMHVITPSRVAGAETFLIRLTRHAGVDQVDHRCITSRNGIVRELRAEGLELESMRIGGKANVLAVPRLFRAAQSYHADLTHSHLSTASWWCGWLSKLGGPPSIGHVHGFTSAHWHRHQTHLIACSAAVKADLIEKGLAADRITVMHYPVDPSDQPPTRLSAHVRAELGADAHTPVVGTFAHLSPKKGYRELVRAARLVLDRLPRAQFWCFGEGQLREEIEKQARAAGIGDRFKLLGFRRDVPDLMRAVDVMCLPSHREPFGLVYVEAGLAGKPVIACDAGGAPEVIAHGETGLLVPPPFSFSAAGFASVSPSKRFWFGGPSHYPAAENVSGLAEAILTLLDNRSQAAAMGRRGRELALERFSWPKYLAQLHGLYDRVLTEGIKLAETSQLASTVLRRAA
jgi:glycosyltransferase involved in cell wall biosynthesis